MLVISTIDLHSWILTREYDQDTMIILNLILMKIECKQLPKVQLIDQRFMNLAVHSNRKSWSTLAQQAHELGMITRIYTVNTLKFWTLALHAGVNQIATDRITNHHWASFGLKKVGRRRMRKIL